LIALMSAASGCLFFCLQDDINRYTHKKLSLQSVFIIIGLNQEKGLVPIREAPVVRIGFAYEDRINTGKTLRINAVFFGYGL